MRLAPGSTSCETISRTTLVGPQISLPHTEVHYSRRSVTAAACTSLATSCSVAGSRTAVYIKTAHGVDDKSSS